MSEAWLGVYDGNLGDWVLPPPPGWRFVPASQAGEVAPRCWEGLVGFAANPESLTIDRLEVLRRSTRATPIAICITGPMRRRFGSAAERLAACVIDTANLEHWTGLVARQRRALRKQIERWRARYGLTPTEVQLLERAVLFGVSRGELAEDRGVQPETVKRQVKVLLAKIGEPKFEDATLRLVLENTYRPTSESEAFRGFGRSPNETTIRT